MFFLTEPYLLLNTTNLQSSTYITSSLHDIIPVSSSARIILASSLTLTCLSLIKSTLCPNLVIFTSETSVHPSNSSSSSSFCSHRPQPLQIHLSPANLTTAIHYTLAFHKQISTNFNAFKTHWHASLQTLQNINTSHQHSKITYTGFQSNKELIINCLLTYKTLTNLQPTFLYQYSVSSSKHISSKLHSIPRLSPISLDCLPGFWFLLFSFYAPSNDT